MHGAFLEAVLCKPSIGLNATTANVHQLKARLEVPDSWITQGTFDHVQFHFVGRLKTRVLFTACRENIIALSGRRSKDEFRQVNTSVSDNGSKRTATFDFAIPNLADLPGSQSVLANSYLARKGGFGGQQVQAHAEIAYHVSARLMRGATLTGCVSVVVRIPQYSPACIAAPSVHEVPVSAPALPRLVRRALNAAPPEDLHVRIFDTPHSSILPIESRSLRVPITLLLRDTPTRARLRSENGILRCVIEARWQVNHSIATEPLDAIKRLAPAVEESTRGPRHRAELAFPPFCETRRHSALCAAGTDVDGKLAYATTAELRIPIPECVFAGPSITRGLFARSFALRIDVAVTIAPDLPEQTAHMRVPLRMLAREPMVVGAFRNDDEGSLSQDMWSGAHDVTEYAPPPTYTLAMQDPVVTITT